VSDQIIKATEQLSSMADKVAGFAISSYLLLTFACLKDIGPWVKYQPLPFAIGAGLAGVVYIVAVSQLYFKELHTRHMAGPSADLAVLDGVSLWLVWARTLGIAAFAAIGILAVWGAGNPPASANADCVHKVTQEPDPDRQREYTVAIRL
jgi:hypothetical protein